MSLASPDGLLLIDKPRGCTSHDVVDRLRRLTGWKKAGHFGSLDPLASGLLIIGFGRATRLFPVLSRLPKTYVGSIRLGVATDTYDAEGQPLAPPSSHLPSQEQLVQSLKAFEGEITQKPPLFSAKKYKGQPSHRLARRGQLPPLKPVKVIIYRLRLISYTPPDLNFELNCSSGTYVRSLAHDLGQTLGCGGHLAELKRVAVGPFRLEEAQTLEEVEKLTRENRVEELLIPLEKVLEDRPKAILVELATHQIAKDRILPKEAFLTVLPPSQPSMPLETGPMVRLFSRDGRFLGLARPGSEPGSLVPFLLL